MNTGMYFQNPLKESLGFMNLHYHALFATCLPTLFRLFVCVLAVFVYFVFLVMWLTEQGFYKSSEFLILILHVGCRTRPHKLLTTFMKPLIHDPLRTDQNRASRMSGAQIAFSVVLQVVPESRRTSLWPQLYAEVYKDSGTSCFHVGHLQITIKVHIQVRMHIQTRRRKDLVIPYLC